MAENLHKHEESETKQHCYQNTVQMLSKVKAKTQAVKSQLPSRLEELIIDLNPRADI